MSKNNHNFWYLAGPMSGIPQFNFPLFERAAKQLRLAGYNIISPVELDDEKTRKISLASLAGDSSELKETWGCILARDVKIVADKVQGIILLPDWEKSRGARLEAYVGILCDHAFRRYTEGCGWLWPTTLPVSSEMILLELFRATK